MIEATNLRAGTTFLMDGRPYRVVKYTHSKVARGGGTVKLSVRNLENGKIEVKSLSSNAKVDDIQTSKRPLQFLYKDAANASFMDSKTFEQVEIPLKILGEQMKFIKEGTEADVLFWSFGGAQDKENKPLSVDIPPKVVLEVTDTAPGVKGDSATNVFKSAKLENNLELKVPLFIKTGDKVSVDTRTGEYVERAK